MCLVALIGIGTADAQKPKKGEKQTVTVEFLTSIDCEGCAKKVNETIPYEKGVRKVVVDVPSKIVTVTYDPAKTNEEALVKAFSKIKINASAEGCADGCCGHDHKAEKKECTDACCEGHNHNHDNGHSHNH